MTQKTASSFMQKLPNYLTFMRILVIPGVVASFSFPGMLAAWIGCGLFIAASVTDYFDGYIARKFKSTSSIGRIFDPIADKLLVAATLLMMAAYDRLGYTGLWPAIVILCREVLVSGLREFLAEIRVGLPVTRLAKWKTGIQMTAIPMLMVADFSPWFCYFGEVGEILIWIAALLTVITGYDYLRAGLKHLDG